MIEYFGTLRHFYNFFFTLFSHDSAPYRVQAYGMTLRSFQPLPLNLPPPRTTRLIAIQAKQFAPDRRDTGYNDRSNDPIKPSCRPSLPGKSA